MSSLLNGDPPPPPEVPAGSVARRGLGLPSRLVPLAWVIGALSTALVVSGAILIAEGLQFDIAVYLMGAGHLMDGRLYLASLPQYPYLPFTYPPFAALVFVPLHLLPHRSAQVVWTLTNVVALFALVWLSIRAVVPELDRRRITLASLVLMTPAFHIEPVLLTFQYGQVNIVLAVLILADLTGTVHVGGRSLPRGLLVGIAAAVKLIPLVFVPYLFVTRQARAAWVALATFVVCSAVPAALDPRVSWAYWTRYVNDVQRVGVVYFISNQSLRAVIDRIDHRVVSVGVTTVLGVVVLVAGIGLARWACRSSSTILGVLVCATTGLLVSPITWAHHMVWAVPVLIWLAWGEDRPAFGRVWAAAGTVLFWWAPIWSVSDQPSQELAEHGWRLIAGNSFFLAMVTFMIGIAVMLWIRRSSAGRSRGPDADRAGAVTGGAAGAGHDVGASQDSSD